MTSAHLGNLSIIVGILSSVIGVALLVRTNIRDQVRQRQADREKAITDARAPLIADNAQLSGQVAALKIDVQRRDDRITQLEDDLRNLMYRRGGPTP